MATKSMVVKFITHVTTYYPSCYLEMCLISLIKDICNEAGRSENEANFILYM